MTLQRILALVFLLGVAACGGQADKPAPSTERVIVTPVAALTAAVPGESYPLLWQFDLADGWHLYWKGRNDSGFPPSLKLTLPDGWRAGDLQWPAPERYLSAGDILDHVYHDQLTLLQDITAPATAVPGTEVTIPVRLDWLICKDECVPGHTEVALKLRVAAQADFTPEAPRLAKALASVPVQVPQGSYELTWGEASVTVKVPSAVKLAFFPDTDCGLLVDLIADGAADAETLTLRFRAGPDGIGPVKGVLHQELPDGRTRNWLINQAFGG